VRSLRGRVSRIEAKSGHRGACTDCGGQKLACVVFGEEPPRPPCAGCGNPPIVVRLIRGMPPEGWAERWRSESEPGV
jgi:hypothetical protein